MPDTMTGVRRGTLPEPAPAPASAPGVAAIAVQIQDHEQHTLPALTEAAVNTAAYLSWARQQPPAAKTPEGKPIPATDAQGRPRVDTAGRPIYGLTPDQVNAAQTAHTAAVEQLQQERQYISDLYKAVGDKQADYAQHAPDPYARERAAAEAANNYAAADLHDRQAASELLTQQQQQAQFEYDQALRAQMPVEEVNRRAQRVDDLNAQAKAAEIALQESAAGVADSRNQSAATRDIAEAALAQVNASVATATAPSAIAQSGGEATSAVAAGVKASAEAARAPEAVDAAINEAVARGDFTQAQALELQELLASKKAYAEENVRNLAANTANLRTQTHQLQVGDIQTKIEQLGEAVTSGMPSWQADRLMEDYLSGSTPFQRQQQRESLATSAFDTALGYGMVTTPGQSYVPGFEPGGAYQAATGALGVGLPTVKLEGGMTMPQYLQAQGVQATEPAAPARFGATGGFSATPTGVSQAPVGVAPAPTAPTVIGAAATPEGFHARAAAAGAVQQVQQAAAGGTFGGTEPYLVMGSEPDWAATAGGWSGGPPGLPSVPPLDPFAPGMGAYPPIGAGHPFITPQAAGGTTVIPVGGGSQPRVRKIPIFAPRGGSGRRPMFAGAGR